MAEIRIKVVGTRDNRVKEQGDTYLVEVRTNKFDRQAQEMALRLVNEERRRRGKSEIDYGDVRRYLDRLDENNEIKFAYNK